MRSIARLSDATSYGGVIVMEHPTTLIGDLVADDFGVERVCSRMDYPAPLRRLQPNV